jgi:hypothetical protein
VEQVHRTVANIAECLLRRFQYRGAFIVAFSNIPKRSLRRFQYLRAFIAPLPKLNHS